MRLNLLTIIWLTVLLGAGVAVFLIERSKTPLPTYATAIAGAKAAVRLVDAAAREVQRVRHELDASFDGLRDMRAPLLAVIDTVRDACADIEDLDIKIKRNARIFENSVQGFAEDLEQFKSAYAAIRNSLRYLPTARNVTVGQLRTHGHERLAEEASILIDSIYNLADTEIARSRTRQAIGRFVEASQDTPHPVRNTVLTLAEHARTVIDFQGPVELHFMRLTGHNVERRIEVLIAELETAARAEALRKRILEFSAAGVGACIGMIWIGGIAGSLRRKRVETTVPEPAQASPVEPEPEPEPDLALAAHARLVHLRAARDAAGDNARPEPEEAMARAPATATDAPSATPHDMPAAVQAQAHAGERMRDIEPAGLEAHGQMTRPEEPSETTTGLASRVPAPDRDAGTAETTRRAGADALVGQTEKVLAESRMRGQQRRSHEEAARTPDPQGDSTGAELFDASLGPLTDDAIGSGSVHGAANDAWSCYIEAVAQHAQAAERSYGIVPEIHEAQVAIARTVAELTTAYSELDPTALRHAYANLARARNALEVQWSARPDLRTAIERTGPEHAVRIEHCIHRAIERVGARADASLPSEGRMPGGGGQAPARVGVAAGVVIEALATLLRPACASAAIEETGEEVGPLVEVSIEDGGRIVISIRTRARAMAMETEAITRARLLLGPEIAHAGADVAVAFEGPIRVIALKLPAARGAGGGRGGAVRNLSGGAGPAPATAVRVMRVRQELVRE